jgi:uncharacterized protein YjiK
MTRVEAEFKIKSLLLVVLLIIALLGAGCSLFEARSSKGPKGYDLNHPEKRKLPGELDEISGITYYPKYDCVFAIIDEVGWLYKIYLNDEKKIEKWSFSAKGDFEDLVLLDSNFYVLKSKGSIAAFNFVSTDSLSFSEFPLSLEKGNEFETLYYDPEIKKLVMVCKDCEEDGKKNVTAFLFNPFDFKYEPYSFKIDTKKIGEMADEEKLKFKPSAAAINPVTKELFIISSVNKMLVVAKPGGDIKDVFRLSEGMFKQPEGICFKPDGTMIISNEAGEDGAANLLIFPFNQNSKKKK